MLCPEVWSFPTNETKIFHKFGSYDKTQKSLDQTITSAPFNNMISLILPGLETIPESIEQLIENSDYYLIRNLTLGEFVRADFIEVFIKQGKLTGTSLSDGNINNNEDIFLISPEGKLTLLISRELYQTIGLEGHPVEYSKRNKDRFEIVIDLRKEKISEKSKSYNRIKKALSRTDITFDFHVSWEPEDQLVCSSSVAKFFNDNGYEVEQHNLRSLSILRDDLRLPHKILSQQQLDYDLTNSLVEYISILTLGCDVRQTVEELNSYKPDPDLNIHSQRETNAVILYCRGLMTSQFVSEIVRAARESVSGESVILSVNGYDRRSRTGLNSYITLFNDKKYLLLKA